jgi:hypothetical protein
MKILDAIVIVYFIVLVARGWLYYNDKYGKVSFMSYLRNFLKIKNIGCIVDLRLITNKYTHSFLINILTVGLYLMILIFLIDLFLK